MLSKVLSRRDSGPDSSRVQPMVFPLLGPGAVARTSTTAGAADAGQGAGEIAALREKVHQIGIPSGNGTPGSYGIRPPAGRSTGADRTAAGARAPE